MNARRTSVWGLGVAIVPTFHVSAPRVPLCWSLSWQVACFTGDIVVWRRSTA